MFRGGTCLHKLYDTGLARYSEDLDYVRRSGGGIGDLTRAVSAIGERLGMEVRTKIGRHPKIFLRAPFESGAGTMRVKVEVNTFERAPARPLTRVPYGLESPWFNGNAEVQTFDLAELVATKIRALFQRSKGRDLFDLWLAITRLGVTPGGSRRLLRSLPTGRLHRSPSRTQPAREAGRRRVPPRPDPARRRVARGLRHR